MPIIISNMEVQRVLKALEISKIRALFYGSDIREASETAAILDPMHIDTRWALVEFYIQLPGILEVASPKQMNTLMNWGEYHQ
ncbi:MAG: hypothetical protein ACI83B_000728 [Sediminicola sp.]|jgi:hypothetical protein